MESLQLSPLETKRTDPVTGKEYIYRAEPIINTFSLESMSTVWLKDFVMSFLWRSLTDDWVLTEYPNFHEEATRVLPILNEAVRVIAIETKDVIAKNELRENELSDKFDYYYSIYFHSIYWDKTLSDDSNSISPEFYNSLRSELMKCEAVKVAVTFFATINKEEFESRPLRTESKPSDAQIQIQPTNTKQSVRINIDKGNTLINMHSIGQMFGSTQDESLIQRGQAWQERYGQAVDSSIDKYGIDLTVIQLRVMEGVLGALTRTNYKGNLEPTTKEELVSNFPAIKTVDDLPKIFNHIKEIPRLKIGKRELVSLAGMRYDSQSDVERVVNALMYLGTTQFCFYYSRLSIGKDRTPERDEKTGEYKKEFVTSFDTLFKVNVVKDDATREFKYYEVSPSAVFLDQKEKYYMLIPYGWKEEIRRLVGERKASSYLYLFILWLRYQFEQKRRKNSRPSTKVKEKYQFVGNWISIAQAIRMPETVYRRNKANAQKIIDSAYSTAKELGYLISYSRKGEIDKLILNPDKYPFPKLSLDEEIDEY